MDVKNKTNSAVHLKSEEETSYSLMSMFPLNQDITEKKKKNPWRHKRWFMDDDFNPIRLEIAGAVAPWQV